MKFLFVIPPYSDLRDYLDNTVERQNPIFTIPYGVLSIAAYIKSKSEKPLDIKVLDLNLEIKKAFTNKKDIKQWVENVLHSSLVEFAPDLLGVSALFNTQFHFLKTLETALENCEIKPFVFLGGGLGINFYKEILSKNDFVNAICYGEGEMPVSELVNAKDINTYIKQSDSWITKEKLIEKSNFERLFVENLDEIPIFDYSLVEFGLYGGRSINKSAKISNVIETSIHTSRGCPFNCIFCSNSTIHGKKIRLMSVEKVISEVKYMVENLHINTLLIEDDHFLSNKNRAKEILRKLADFNLSIEFPNGIAAYGVDEEVALLMKKAGVTVASLAIESGSDYELKYIIDKPATVDVIRKATYYLKKANICIHAFIVLGIPGELEEHRQETRNLLLELQLDWVHFFIATPIVGSRLFELCKQNNYLVNEEDFANYSVNRCNIVAPGIDPVQIEKIAYLFNLEINFLKNPYYLQGDYDEVLPKFMHVAKSYTGHALSNYLIADIYNKQGNKEASEQYTAKYKEILDNSELWRDYFSELKIKV